MKHFLLILMTGMMAACSETTNVKQTYVMHGAWTLRHIEYPTGTELNYPTESGETFCRIYDGDSIFYECQLATTATGMIILPHKAMDVTLIDKGGGERIYLEGDNPQPLTIVNDSTAVIQHNGALSTWLKDNNKGHMEEPPRHLEEKKPA